MLVEHCRASLWKARSHVTLRNLICGHCRNFQFGEGGDDLDGFEADSDDLTDEAENIFAIVLAIWIIGDAAAFVGGDLVLVDDPFEGGAVAKTVIVGFRRDAGEREELVVDERGFVFAQLHFDDAVVEFFALLFCPREFVFGLLFVVDVDFGETLTGFCEGMEDPRVILTGVMQIA